MLDGTLGAVRGFAIETGALGQCPHCGEHHLASSHAPAVEDCIASVEAAKAEGDNRLLGLTDVGAYVRHMIESSPTLCEVRSAARTTVD